MTAIPIEFIIILVAFVFIFIGIIIDYFKLFKILGAILLIVMGIFVFYPGISGLDVGSLNAIALGTICIGLGFYFMLESFFHEEKTFEEAENEEDD